jgi:transposase
LNYHALDLDKKTAFASRFDTLTQTQSEQRIKLDPTSLMSFKSTLQPDDVLCMEACPGSNYLHDVLSLACQVHLVDPIVFGALLRIFKKKTDRNDAGKMLDCLRAGILPTVWVPPLKVRDERALSQHYKDLDEDRTRLLNQAHALLVEYGFGFQADELLKMDARLLLARVQANVPELSLSVLATKLKRVREVERDLAEARARIVTHASNSPQADFAASVPGIDRLLAFAGLAVIDEVKRFVTPASLPNYAGLTPSLHSSGLGNKPKHGRITKRGSTMLRWMAVEAAKNAVRTPGRFQNLYARLRRRGRTHQQAVVAAARKLLEVLWHVLTKQEAYRDVSPHAQEQKTKRRERKLTTAQTLIAALPDPRQQLLASISTVRELVQMAR